MVTHKEKLDFLRRLNEAQFRTDVLIPLLKKMAYQKVRERHGPQEYGKDITFYEASPLGGMYYAVVAKAGDISGAASGQKNLEVVKAQINHAFIMPFDDVEDKQRHHIDRVIVWTTGNISNNAQALIMELARDRFRNVDFKHGEATVELLDKYLSGFFTVGDAFVAGYYGAVREYYSRLEELRTLGTSSDKRTLSAIFVPPSLSQFGPRSRKTNTKTYRFEAILRLKRNVVLLGSAGSGKSTLLRKMLLDTIARNERALRPEPIPVLVRLKDVDFCQDQPIERSLIDELSRFGLADVVDQLATRLQSGKILVLLDGLDELQAADRIKEGIGHVTAFTERFTATRVVMASRFLDVLEQPNVLPRFRMLRINNFTPKQIVSFIRKWCAEDKDIARKLIRLVSGAQGVCGLPATPLTLALVAIVQEASPWQEMPANQAELFAKYVELALGRWDAGKDLSVQFEYPVKRFILQTMAWNIHEKRRSYISVTDFDEWIETLSEDRGLPIDLETFRREVIERSELLFRNEDGHYEFKHQSFQDYFVGLEINRKPDATEFVVSNFLDPWWSSCIQFAGGARPAYEEYIEAIVERVRPSGSGSLFFALSLGELLQATFMATRRTKANAVNAVLDSFIHSWQAFCEMYTDLKDKSMFPKDATAHLLGVLFHASAAQWALASVTLSSVLSDLADDLRRRPAPDLPPRESAIREWRAFLLAMACAGCDQNVSDFVQLFASEAIREPSFLLIGHLYAAQIAERDWLESAKRREANTLSKKLDARWGTYDEYRRYLRKVQIIPLPLPDPGS